MLLSKSINQAE